MYELLPPQSSAPPLPETPSLRQSDPPSLRHSDPPSLRQSDPPSLRQSDRRKCRFLQRLSANGWTLDRITGSHHVLRKSGCRPVPIPIHCGFVARRMVKVVWAQMRVPEPPDESELAEWLGDSGGVGEDSGAGGGGQGPKKKLGVQGPKKKSAASAKTKKNRPVTTPKEVTLTTGPASPEEISQFASRQHEKAREKLDRNKEAFEILTAAYVATASGDFSSRILADLEKKVLANDRESFFDPSQELDARFVLVFGKMELAFFDGLGVKGIHTQRALEREIEFLRSKGCPYDFVQTDSVKSSTKASTSCEEIISSKSSTKASTSCEEIISSKSSTKASTSCEEIISPIEDHSSSTTPALIPFGSSTQTALILDAFRLAEASGRKFWQSDYQTKLVELRKKLSVYVVGALAERVIEAGYSREGSEADAWVEKGDPGTTGRYSFRGEGEEFLGLESDVVDEDSQNHREPEIGELVRVTDLGNQQHYNGLWGKVLRFDPNKNRYVVAVEYEGEGKQLNLRKNNISMKMVVGRALPPPPGAPGSRENPTQMVRDPFDNFLPPHEFRIRAKGLFAATMLFLKLFRKLGEGDKECLAEMVGQPVMVGKW